MDMRKYFLIILLFTGFVSQGQTPMRMLAKKATSSAVLEALTFTNKSSGFVESPAGSWGQPWGGDATATKSLPGDGWIQVDVTSTANKTSCIGLSLTNTLQPLSGIIWDYTLYVFGGVYASNNADYSYGNNAGTATVGDVLRIKRTGTTITTEYYRSGSWTTLYTFPTTTSATLYLKVENGGNTGSDKVVNPKGYNVH